MGIYRDVQGLGFPTIRSTLKAVYRGYIGMRNPYSLGFPTITGTIWGSPLIRTTAFWDLHLGSPDFWKLPHGTPGFHGILCWTGQLSNP